MKFLVAGSGAMGSCFGHMLHKGGHQVTLCDNWEESIELSKTRGLLITDVDTVEKSELTICKPEEVKGDFDCVLVFCKSYQLESMCEQIKPLVKENTKVLCILNGLGHVNTLQKYFDKKQIIMGVTVVTAKLLGPAEFLISAHSPTEVAPIDPNEREACERIINAFCESTMPFVYSNDIMYSIWRKACLNGTSNSICALLDINLLQQGQIPRSLELVKDILVEFSAVAKAVDNVDIDVEQVAEYLAFFLTPEFKGCKHYPSMWQDLVANKRPTEIDYLNGYVAAKAKEHGLSAPYNDCITMLVHGKEKSLGII